jgi:hypothetical protein
MCSFVNAVIVAVLFVLAFLGGMGTQYLNDREAIEYAKLHLGRSIERIESMPEPTPAQKAEGFSFDWRVK